MYVKFKNEKNNIVYGLYVIIIKMTDFHFEKL